MKYRLEVFVLPVSDIDRAKAFYERCGWNCDVDHDMGEVFRVVQFTPPGSDCSISFGRGMPLRAEPGSYTGMHLVVTDVEEAVADLRSRDVEISDPFHFGESGPADGVHPERIKFGTYASFDDPDGNTWLLQESPA